MIRALELDRSARPSPEAAPVRAGFAAIGDIRMYFEIHGDGPPVLMLNGGVQTSDDYRPLARGMADRHSFILVDHRGRGRTGDGTGAITYGRIADDVVKLLDVLGLPRTSLVGHSEGGVVALELLLRYPRRVDRAVLIGTPLEATEADKRWFEAEKKAMKARRFEDVRFPAAAAMYEVYARVAPDPSRWPMAVEKVYDCWLAQRTYGPTLLHKIDRPVLVISAEQDQIVPKEVGERTARGIRGARLLSIPGAGHHVPMSQPDVVTKALRGFLEARAK